MGSHSADAQYDHNIGELDEYSIQIVVVVVVI